MKFLFSYLNRRRKSICVGSLLCASTALMFYLYDLAWEPFCYILAFWFFLCLPVFWLDFRHDRRRHRGLTQLAQNPEEAAQCLPPSHNLVEQDYQALIHAIADNHTQVTADYAARSQELTDYYTLWAHQIKTPIAAMGLLLQEEPVHPELLAAELGKVEDYVEMALSYLRLDSDSSDYVLRRYDLDTILRACVRKYARLFILKRIELELDETHAKVLTDEKWLSFVIGQLLSNALKYTPEQGRISVTWEDATQTLTIGDTGIGIRPEDLPRVFEKGFTGYNGREQKKSTGIGLYLCRRVLGKLGHTIVITSTPGQGTQVQLGLAAAEQVVE